MAPTPVEEIKQRLDIVTFLREYLTLQPAGRNFKAACPFHKERTPSFMVSPDRQSWHCFGCGLGGDAFTFLMRHENIDFSDALRMLAEKTGVELRRLSLGEQGEQQALYDVVAAARDFFVDQLKKSPQANAYLKSRSLNEETQTTFEIGWAPPGTETLTVSLLKKGFRPEALIKAGVSLRSPNGLVIDRFRGRIMFPLHNHLGKVVGFTGRILPEYDTGEMGKYVNTPETPIFSKSRILYGFHKSKHHVKDAGAIIVVEGQMDFLMLWQLGVRNVVASSGTALTLDHLKLMERLADTLVLTFDRDEAGQAAGERAIDLASGNDFNVKVVVLSEEIGPDPAEAAVKNPEALKKALQEGVPGMVFYFERHLPKSAITTDVLRESKRSLRLVLEKLKHLSSAVERDLWLKDLSRRTGVSGATLLEEMSKISSEISTRSSFEESTNETSRPITRQERILLQLFAVGLAGERFPEIESSLVYATPVYRKVYDHLKSKVATSDEPDLDELLKAVYLRADRDFDEEEFRSLLRELKEEYLRNQRLALKARIQAAEERGDEKELEKALTELHASWNI